MYVEGCGAAVVMLDNSNSGDYEGSGYSEEGYLVNVSGVVRKMDSGCSRNMSGVVGRLVADAPDVDFSNIVINGFNKSSSKVDAVGVNSDDKLEYYVKSMPNNLVLLSAYDYARDGAIVLYGDSGYVYKLSACELERMRKYMSAHMPSKVLAVNNRTYDVVGDGSVGEFDYNACTVYDCDSDEMLVDSGFGVVDVDYVTGDSCVQELVLVANTYFNTKVNVSNVEERILVYLMSGLTLKDMFKYVKYKNISGLHPDVTTSALNRFEHKWGSTPDAFQLAHPNRDGNRKGYMSERAPLTKVGEYVEMDFMECEFNEESPVAAVATSLEQQNGLKKRKKAAKLATHGGAIAGNVWVDAYSGYVGGELVKTTARPIELVQRCVQALVLEGHQMQTFAADSGVSSQSMFQVFTPQVDAYLLEQRVHSVRSEPYNHSNGTPHVENVIKPIKLRIRMATQYLLSNPNFIRLNITEEQVLRLWGELFYWAMMVINLSECSNVPGKTKYEVFTGRRPNIQEIRLLPIFSIVMVYRNVPTGEIIGRANRSFYQYGVYCGFDLKVSGGIRVALVTNSRLSVVVTTKYKGVSDGGGLNDYPIIERGVQRLLSEPPAGVDVGNGDGVGIVDTMNDNVRVDIAADDDTSSDVVHTDNDLDDNVHVDIAADGTSSSDVVHNGKENDAATGDNFRSRVQQLVVDTPVPAVKPSQVRGVKGTVARKVTVDNGVRSTGYDPDSRPSRAERMLAKNNALVDNTDSDRESANFADWSNYADGDVHYSFADHSYYVVSSVINADATCFEETGYKVVTTGVPKNFSAGLKDPEWGDPCRVEWSGLMDMKTLVQMQRHIAEEDIRKGADVVILFPIYEIKMKEGKEVKKVRLVCNGKTQRNAGATYSPTPSKDELLVLLHMCAKCDWDYCHIDEKRAFLNAPYRGDDTVYARLRGDPNYYKILGALYGLKTSPRHYSVNSAERMLALGFKRLHMCSCIFVRYDDDGDVVFAYVFVDDYVPCGNKRSKTELFVSEFMKVVNTTPPVWNATSVLGMSITRDWDKHTIQISLSTKITELGDRLGMSGRVVKHMPIPSSGYIVNDADFDEMRNKLSAEYLSDEDIVLYMQIVGSLIWIGGIRQDVHYGLMYLTWFTRKPRVHHMTMAYYCVSYLYYSKDVPLVLGGSSDLVLETFFDSSWGTGPKGRSICAVLCRLGSGSACIVAKTTASACTVSMSSFESELETCTLAMKTTKRIKNVLDELGFKLNSKPMMYNDNEAMINFVKGEGMAKGARHMELRMWYVREQFAMGNVDMMHMPGTVLPADRLTKPSTKQEQAEFTRFVMGLALL